ncbi:MAG TPA: ribosome silencing factor [Steroidobacteraceae bacterium]
MPTEKKPQKPRASLKKHVTRAPKGLPAKAGTARPGTPTRPDTPTRAGTRTRAGTAQPGTTKGGIAGADIGKAGAAKPAATKRSLKSVVLDALDDMKALEVKVLDVRGLTDIADYMVIASGTSDRHVRSVAQRVVEKAKEAGFRPHGIEGQQDADWVLIDLHEYIVHVMLPRVREFYGLEKLWDMTAKRAVRA